MPSESPAFALVIVNGEAKNERFVVRDRAVVIGRGGDADFRIRDPRISRLHAHVTARAEGLHFRCHEGTTPLLIDSNETHDGIARPGQQVVIGETVLAVAAVARPPLAEATDVRTLLSGVAADVRGLGAIVALTEALDAASSRADVISVLRTWGERYVDVVAVRFVEDASGANDVVPRLTEDGKVASIRIPAHAGVGVAIELDVAPATEDVGLSRVRLLAVAGRVCGSTLARIDAMQSIERERASLRDLAVGSARNFLGASPAAAAVTKLVARLAASDVIALLEGETGVGKTFVARLVHEASPRARSPLMVVNCAAIPEALIESELFGHERGAFTGATTSRAGVLEAAGEGTVLLDEIGELPPAHQAKLLHVLEDRSFTRVGSTRAVRLRARVLAATNRDLEAMVAEGTFRRDLFFRLCVVRVQIPPIRDRGEDLVLLARHILADLSASSPRRVNGFTAGALDVIQRYPWPGNVRELRNVIEHAIVLGEGAEIGVDDLPQAVRVGAAAVETAKRGGPAAAPAADGRRTVDLPANLEWIERQAIEAALAATGGNQRQAAAILGINRVTLHRKLRSDKPE